MAYSALGVGLRDVADGTPPFASMVCPVVTGLRAMHFLCNGMPLRNWAPEGPAKYSRLAGTMTESLGYANVAVNSYIDTRIPESAAVTLLAVFRRTDTGGGTGIIGSYNGGGNEGAGIYTVGAGALIQSSVQKTSGGVNQSVAATPDSWTMTSLTVPAAGASKLRNETTGAQSTSSNADARAFTGTDNVYLGGLPSTGFRRNVDVAFGAVWDVALTDGDLASCVAWARAHCAAFGIEV